MSNQDTQDTLQRLRYAETFMAWVKEQMRKHGISQYALAAEMGEAQFSVWRWLHGRRPQLETALRIDAAMQRLIAEKESL